jgi:ABC-type dipeptide/oligopeptide/nickel transport system permease subunit
MLPSVALSAALALATAVGIDAALAYLEVGTPAHTWGTALGLAPRVGDWRLALWPGLSIAAAVLASRKLAEGALRRIAALPSELVPRRTDHAPSEN